MEKTNDKDLNNLVSAYHDLINSKMVLAEKHISKLLKVVAENDFVYNLIAEKILGYDFNNAFNRLVSGDLETSELVSQDAIIPFVFCLLNEIDNKTIETVALIRELYKSDSEEAFKNFCEQFVGEFVSKVLEYSGNHNLSEDEDDSSAIEEIFTSGLDERVRYIVGVITDKISVFKKVKPEQKRDLDIICFSIDLCLERGEFAGIFGLLSGLKYVLISLKKFKSEIAEIELILDSINNA